MGSLPWFSEPPCGECPRDTESHSHGGGTSGQDSCSHGDEDGLEDEPRGVWKLQFHRKPRRRLGLGGPRRGAGPGTGDTALSPGAAGPRLPVCCRPGVSAHPACPHGRPCLSRHIRTSFPRLRSLFCLLPAVGFPGGSERANRETRTMKTETMALKRRFK